MKRILPLVGIGASLLLISATPPPAAPVETPAAAAGTPTDDGVVDAIAAEPSSSVRVIPPEPDAVARWCNAEQQGAHALAEQLRRREREIDEVGRSLRLREEELKTAEAGLDARLAQLQKTRDQIESVLKTADAQDEKRITDLVKMVEANRATAAAPILAAVAPDLAVRVLDRMNTQKAGKILAAMNPAQAAALAERFTKPIPLEAP